MLAKFVCLGAGGVQLFGSQLFGLHDFRLFCDLLIFCRFRFSFYETITENISKQKSSFNGVFITMKMIKLYNGHAAVAGSELWISLFFIYIGSK